MNINDFAIDLDEIFYEGNITEVWMKFKFSYTEIPHDRTIEFKFTFFWSCVKDDFFRTRCEPDYLKFNFSEELMNDVFISEGYMHRFIDKLSIDIYAVLLDRINYPEMITVYNRATNSTVHYNVETFIGILYDCLKVYLIDVVRLKI